MNVIAPIGMVTRLFFGCSHLATYRERRPLEGAAVMHLVCHDCGHASPVMDRTPAEHLRAIDVGAIHAPRAQRSPAPVIRIARSRRKLA
jgi:hypothetical protein